MRFLKFSSFVFLLASILWVILPHHKLPAISLPRGVHHNTFGELPFVEVMDDGDFYEKDGDEEGTYSSCINDEFNKINYSDPKELDKLYRDVEKNCAYKFRKQLKDNCTKDLIGLCEYCKTTNKDFRECVENIQAACQRTENGFIKYRNLENIFRSGSPVYTCNMEFK